jgi:hypothetical protein
MSIDEFITKDQYNLEQVRTLLPHFRELVPGLDGLYGQSRELMPVVADLTTLTFARCHLVCHKGLLAAAATIGRRHPDDAAAITRRAIEAARIARAVKHDPANLGRWQDYEKRLERWSQRELGRRPRPIKPTITYPPDHPGLETLRGYEGVLSDIFVHFTPEFVESRGWTHQAEGPRDFMTLPYHERDQRQIEREFIALGAIHVGVLDLFDECFDRAFSRDRGWLTQRGDVSARGVALRDRFNAEGPKGGSDDGSTR